MTAVGAAVAPTSGQSWDAAIAAFEALTGGPLPVRRAYDGSPVGDIASSNAQYDLGVRKTILSIKPTMTTMLSTLTSLADSIVAAGHECDVVIYHEPVDNMTGDEFIALYQRSCTPFRTAGVPVGVCFTNWSCSLPFSDPQSALAHYWPGDGLVDFVYIDEYPIGEITSTKDAVPMSARTRRVSQFCDARGVYLGVAEYGVDVTWDAKKSDAWLRSVTDWARERADLGRPLRALCYWHNAVSGGADYHLNSHPEYVAAYGDACALL